MHIELYEHNKKVYEKIKEQFKKNNKCCVIQPTGTGKAFLMLKWLYENKDKKCLFVTSYAPIINQMIKHIESSGLSLKDFPNLKLKLYANITGEDINKNYDCIGLDEFHRCGAEVWGKNINKIIENNPNALILGTSATPIRYLDNGRDMSDELFEGNIASQIDLVEAILDGILPIPTIISAVYSFTEDINKIQNKINKYPNISEREELQKELDRAKKMVDKCDGIKEILEQNIKDKNGRCIVFCKDIEHMNEVLNKIPEWFNGVNKKLLIKNISSRKTYNQNIKAINEFENNESASFKILVSVDMANEGLHIKNVDMALCLRNTQSTNIALQQIGRAFSTNNKIGPIIFDMVNNINNLGQIEEIIQKLETYPTDNKRVNEFLNKIKINAKVLEIKEILTNLDINSSYTWNEYYTLAQQYYIENGNLLIQTNYAVDNINLGIWLKNQKIAYDNRTIPKDQRKNTYKPLTDEQVEKLENIGMIWGNTSEYWWNKKYALAQQYYMENGHLDISRRFVYKKVNLGNWIERQRLLYKTKNKLLTPEKIKKLENIGMIWSKKKKIISWDEYYELAKKYQKEHGDLLVESSYIINGLNLGYWIKGQKNAYLNRTIPKDQRKTTNKPLTDEQVEKLESIGMIFENTSDYIWERNYLLAKKYQKEHGDLLVPSEYMIEGINLGNWIANQKVLYFNNQNPKIKKYKNRGTLTNEQIKKLESIGMIWENTTEYWWNKKYALAQQYYIENGDLLIQRSYTIDNIDLGQWISGQRRAYNNTNLKENRNLKVSVLTEDQIQKLESIGMIWNVKEYKFVNDKLNKNKLIKLEQRFHNFLDNHENTKFESYEDVLKIVEEFKNTLGDDKNHYKTKKLVR